MLTEDVRDLPKAVKSLGEITNLQVDTTYLQEHMSCCNPFADIQEAPDPAADILDPPKVHDLTYVEPVAQRCKDIPDVKDSNSQSLL